MFGQRTGRIQRTRTPFLLAEQGPQHLTTKAEEHEQEPGTKQRLPGAEGPPEGENVLEQVAVICSVPLGPLGRKASSAAY